VGGWVFIGLSPKEPIYEGRRLSEWIDDYFIDHRRIPGGDEKSERAIQAVRAIGSNGIPILIEWAQAKDLPLKTKVVSFLNRHSLTNFHSTTAEEWQERAFKGFWILETNGVSAVPVLSRWLESSDAELRMHALRCLSAINPDEQVILPVLEKYVNDADTNVQMIVRVQISVLRWHDKKFRETNDPTTWLPLLLK
jgi:hypothetical protein